MAMLTNLGATRPRVSWAQRALIVLCAAPILALPAIHLSTAGQASAIDDRGTAARKPSIEFLPKPTPGEERILAALEQITAINATETPLVKLVEELAERHKLQIQLDNRALENDGISVDCPITRFVSDVKLRSALKLMLRDLDLTYIIRDEVLLITTCDIAEVELYTRTYPVGDLTEGESAGTLIETITTTVRPTSWDESGGPGSIVFLPAVDGLVVSHNLQCQDEVLELLRSLRAARTAQ